MKLLNSSSLEKRSIHLTRYERGVSCKEEKDKWCPACALEKYRQAGNRHGSSSWKLKMKLYFMRQGRIIACNYFFWNLGFKGIINNALK